MNYVSIRQRSTIKNTNLRPKLIRGWNFEILIVEIKDITKNSIKAITKYGV